MQESPLHYEIQQLRSGSWLAWTLLFKTLHVVRSVIEKEIRYALDNSCDLVGLVAGRAAVACGWQFDPLAVSRGGGGSGNQPRNRPALCLKHLPQIYAD
jgi:hypothetical protein